MVLGSCAARLPRNGGAGSVVAEATATSASQKITAQQQCHRQRKIGSDMINKTRCGPSTYHNRPPRQLAKNDHEPADSSSSKKTSRATNYLSARGMTIPTQPIARASHFIAAKSGGWFLNIHQPDINILAAFSLMAMHGNHDCGAGLEQFARDRPNIQRRVAGDKT